MSAGRIMIAIIVAVSVAILPVAGVAASDVKSADMSVTHDMSAAHDMSDCCPPQTAPCDKAIDDCGCMAVCAGNCFSILGTAFSNLVFPIALAETMPSLASQTSGLQTSNLPFRPPRV